MKGAVFIMVAAVLMYGCGGNESQEDERGEVFEQMVILEEDSSTIKATDEHTRTLKVR